jgi:predicted TIM-barrel fold metal-dependent hydrolase
MVREAGDIAPRELLGMRDGGESEPGPTNLSPEAIAQGRATMEMARTCEGSVDPHARLRDMDADGITSDVIFAGAQNGNQLPWMGAFDMGSVKNDAELRVLGSHMWNQWLADFVSVAPERLLGVMQIPIWDIDAAIEEVRWGAAHGLRAINFAAPRIDYPAYNEDVYEPFWAVVEEVGLPLVTHNASGDRGVGHTGRGSLLLWLAETMWLSRRGLGQLIFGGVFDRYPSITLAFVEQRAHWVHEAVTELDSVFLGGPTHHPLPLLGGIVEAPKKMPSEYWLSNCVVAASFMAPFEAGMRHEIGINTLMWGSDYPHIEGTWPRTRPAMRNTFAGVPEEEVRIILEDNGIRTFHLDTTVLRPIADQIGPTPSELARPLEPDEFPAYHGLAFREAGSYH